MEQGDFRYAGFWIRVAAHAIDSIIMLLVLVPVVWWFYGGEIVNSRTVQISPLGHMGFNLGPAIAILLFWHYRSATPGKMILGLRIVDAQTLGKPSTLQFIGRFFAYLVSLIPLLIGFFWVAFDAQKQGWHDKIARTVVVYSRG